MFGLLFTGFSLLMRGIATTKDTMYDIEASRPENLNSFGCYRNAKGQLIYAKTKRQVCVFRDQESGNLHLYDVLTNTKVKDIEREKKIARNEELLKMGMFAVPCPFYSRKDAKKGYPNGYIYSRSSCGDELVLRTIHARDYYIDYKRNIILRSTEEQRFKDLQHKKFSWLDRDKIYQEVDDRIMREVETLYKDKPLLEVFKMDYSIHDPYYFTDSLDVREKLDMINSEWR